MRELITERIITCWNETGAPLHSDREMYGDPLQAYRQSGGSWTDTDADRIPDIVEIYFSNTTNIENETMWEEYLSNTTTGSLFQNYIWCREYYLDLQKNNTSLAENWTQKAFNPFVSYNLPPTIVGYDVHFTKRHSGWTVTVKIDFSYTVRDASGIQEIKITIKDKFSSTVLYGSIERFPEGPTEHDGHDSCTVDYSGFGYIFIIEVSNGMNEVTTEHVFNELLGEVVDEVVDALAALAEMLLGGLQKAWEAVQNAVNVIVEWIKGIFVNGISALVDTLKSAFGPYIEEIAKLLGALGGTSILFIRENAEIPGDTLLTKLNSVMSTFIGNTLEIANKIFVVLLGIRAVESTISAVLTALSPGISTVLKKLLSKTAGRISSQGVDNHDSAPSGR